MYIDKTYPFEPIKCPNFYALDACLGEKSLLIHYNQIYCPSVAKLNCLLREYPTLQKSSLDEIIFNSDYLKIPRRQELIHLANKVYNHHVFFSSISPNKCCFQNLAIVDAINKSFNGLDKFMEQFIKTCLEHKTNGFVYLVSDKDLNLSIYETTCCESPIPKNLYPLMCIDLWEHSYYLKFTVDKASYVNNFLSVLNWEHINSEYLECCKCIL